MKYSTFIGYKSGRTEILHHKNKPDMERLRKNLAKMLTVDVYRTPTKDDLMEAKKW